MPVTGKSVCGSDSGHRKRKEVKGRPGQLILLKGVRKGQSDSRVLSLPMSKDKEALTEVGTVRS